MTSPLLMTKLHAPGRRAGTVARPRLMARLRQAEAVRVTLISAPAGFGKSTLLADWLASRPDPAPVAWVSLDSTDNEPVIFWRYVIAALRQAVPGLGEEAGSLLERPGTPTDATLTALLNDLAAVARDVVLVLDDYHLIEAPDIHVGLAFLVEHLPPQVHLAIATRSDPPLPLARLRARGELLEIRAADLRFTREEAATYLGGSMGLALADDDVERLERRTEGWIAALQLAALSMQGRDDPSAFIAGFAGDDRYLVDYLAEEVLRRQPEDVTAFLLRTSILDRLSGPLCDAVTGQGTGTLTLEALDRANLFLVPLDDRRRWYRYHHLFGDALRARLTDERPTELSDLHGRASAWHEANGDLSEAIRHAIGAGDVARAADLIERATPEMHRARQEWTIRRWHEALPSDAHAGRPILAVGFAGALMSTGSTQGVVPLLDLAHQALGGPFPGRDTTAAGRLPAQIQLYRAGLAQLRGDVDATLEHARLAIESAADHDLVTRGGAASLIALALWTTGDVRGAERAYRDGMATLARAGHEADLVGGAVTVGDLLIAQGRLRDALQAFERGLERATRGDGPPLRGAADMHVGMAAIACERNDLARAAEHLRLARELGDVNGLPKYPHRWRLVDAALRSDHGEVDAAWTLLDEAERRYDGDFSPDVRPVAAIRARLWIAHGRLDEARAWARDRGLSVDAEPTYLREFELASLARLLVAAGRGEAARIDEAIGLLDRLVPPARAAGRMGAVIDLLVALAMAHQARGDVAGAIDTLREAAALAEPEGHVRVFLDEGPPMAGLLRAAASRRDASSGVRRLAAAVARPAVAPLSAPLAAAATGPATGHALVEPLSARELDVLVLLDSDLDGPAVASHLYLSLNTVRTHTKNIYAKLGVNNRRAAVRRAAELGLLSRDRDRPPTG